MADWQSFATGFLESVGKNYTKAAEKSEEYEDRLRELAERNKATAGKYELLRNNATNTVKQLRLLGVSEPAIAAAAESSATGLMDLQKKTLGAVSSFQAQTGQKPTPEELAGMMSYSEEFRETYAGQAGKVDELISNLYGGPKSVIGDTEAAERGFFGSLFPPSKQAIRARLDAEKTDYGYSVYDLAELAGTQPYNPTGSGAYFSFQKPNFFEPEDVPTEVSMLNKYMATEVASFRLDKSFEDAETFIKGTAKAYKDGSISAAEREKYEAARNLVNRKKAEALDGFVGNRAGRFEGASYIENMGFKLDNFVPNYSSNFIERATAETRAVDEQMSSVTREAGGTPEEAVPEEAATAEAVTVDSAAEDLTEETLNSLSNKYPLFEDVFNNPNITVQQSGSSITLEAPKAFEGAVTVGLNDDGSVKSFKYPGKRAFTGEEAVDRFKFLNTELRSKLAAPYSYDPTAAEVRPLAAPDRSQRVLTMTPEEITAALESGDIKRGLINENVVRKLNPKQRAALGYPELDGLFRLTEAFGADGGSPSKEQVREKSQQLLFKEDAKNNPDKLYVIRMPGGPKRRGFRESRVIKGSILAQIPDEALISGDINRNMISEYKETPFEEYGDPVGGRDPFFGGTELEKYFGIQAVDSEKPSKEEEEWRKSKREESDKRNRDKLAEYERIQKERAAKRAAKG